MASSAEVERFAANLTLVSLLQQEHVQLFTRLGFLQTLEMDGTMVALIIGKNFSWSRTRHLLPSLYSYIASQLELVADSPYTLLYIHTDCSYFRNSPGIRWLWSTYRGLTQQCRDNLQACYVVHPDWLISVAAAALCPGDLWKKLTYVPRMEFLPPSLAPCALALPNFVREHEQELSKQPLMDYGILADAQETPLPHLANLK